MSLKKINRKQRRRLREWREISTGKNQNEFGCFTTTADKLIFFGFLFSKETFIKNINEMELELMFQLDASLRSHRLSTSDNFLLFPIKSSNRVVVCYSGDGCLGGGGLNAWHSTEQHHSSNVSIVSVRVAQKPRFRPFGNGLVRRSPWRGNRICITSTNNKNL